MLGAKLRKSSKEEEVIEVAANEVEAIDQWI
jgi:hypothetical protein